MKNRLFFQKVTMGLAVLMGLLIAGCDMDVLNELRNPEDFYAKKGGLMIYNVSSSDPIQSVTVTDNHTNLSVENLIVQGQEGEGLVPIEKDNGVRLIVLNPGTYSVAVTYPNGTQPKPLDVEIKWKEIERRYVSNGAAGAAPYGILQAINFSGVAVTSLKVGDMNVLPDGKTIENNNYYSVSRTPNGYKVEVMTADSKSHSKQVEINAGEVTTITITQAGIEGEMSVPAAENNNLWILNRLGGGSTITQVEEKHNQAGYTKISKGDIPDAGYLGVRLDPSTYDFRITFGDSPTDILTSTGIILTSSDPVFLIVQLDSNNRPGIEVVIPGDTDEDGFPDWWERQYFGEEAVTDPNSPPRDGDPDGDKLTNEEEYLAGTKPTVADSDGDGLTDWEEINGKKDPNYDDTKRPGYDPNKSPPVISDTFPKTNPLTPDTDGDGYSDYVEIRDGSDPTDGGSIPRWGTTITVPWGKEE